MVNRRGSQTALREANLDAVLAALRLGPATQAELARATALSAATVSTIARELVATGSVNTVHAGGRGQQLRLSARSGLTAGIAFGNHRALIALGDLSSRVLSQQVVPMTARDSARDVLRRALEQLDTLLSEQGVGRSSLAAVGISVPTPLSGGGGAAQHTRWGGVNLHTELSDVLSCGVHVDNDANLGARAEYRWGELQGARVAAWVKASTGVGLGLLLEGRVQQGAKGLAGEVGHLSTDVDGPLCWCGNRGCLELYAGSPALVREYATATGVQLTASELVAACVSGDVVAARLVTDAGTRIGAALAGLVTLVDPDQIVIGGDLAAAGDLLLDPLVAALRRSAMPAISAGVRLSVSTLADQAEVLGALALALDHARPLVPS